MRRREPATKTDNRATAWTPLYRRSLAPVAALSCAVSCPTTQPHLVGPDRACTPRHASACVNNPRGRDRFQRSRWATGGELSLPAEHGVCAIPPQQLAKRCRVRVCAAARDAGGSMLQLGEAEAEAEAGPRSKQPASGAQRSQHRPAQCSRMPNCLVVDAQARRMRRGGRCEFSTARATPASMHPTCFSRASCHVRQSEWSTPVRLKAGCNGPGGRLQPSSKAGICRYIRIIAADALAR